jgi:hypothetical protein
MNIKRKTLQCKLSCNDLATPHARVHKCASEYPGDDAIYISEARKYQQLGGITPQCGEITAFRGSQDLPTCPGKSESKRWEW